MNETLLKDLTCEEFIAKLAGNSPVPGGGGAAALAGALGTALGEMVVSLTYDNKKYESVRENMREYAETSREIRDKLTDLIDEDAKVFQMLMAAYRLPRDTETKKKLRAEKLEVSLRDAAGIPFAIMKECCRAIELMEKIAISGNSMAISDAACGALICDAALKSASMNVLINTAAMTDAKYACSLNLKVSELLEEYSPRAFSVYDRIKKQYCEANRDSDLSEKPEILSGKAAAEKIKSDCLIMAEELRGKGITPTLAVVRVGENPADLAYEKGLQRTAAGCGVEIKIREFPENISETLLADEIRGLNENAEIHGVLIFKPLPAHIREEKINDLISPCKDVDGISTASMAYAYSKKGSGFYPCTAEACMEILDYYDIDVSGKNIAVLGRSLVIGKPLAMMLTYGNATVTLCHSRTKNLKNICKDADIIAICMGRARMIDEEYLDAAGNQLVLDVGINTDEDGKLCGDLNPASAAKAGVAYTPVPGGVGSVTSAVLMKHTLLAAYNAS